MIPQFRRRTNQNQHELNRKSNKMTSKNFVQWIQSQFDDNKDLSIKLISGDASFRKYYRVLYRSSLFVAVDSPPSQEKNQEFLNIQAMMASAGVAVPDILASDLEQGFILQQDLGDTQLFQVIDQTNAIFYYQKAIDMLLVMQSQIDPAGLPIYDNQLLIQEMMLFKDWLIGKHCEINLTSHQTADLLEAFNYLKRSALEQQQRFVHRDFHSRNLMVCEGDQLVAIDFQDAVCGAVTYDLVSLLRDCYLVWPKPLIEHLVHYAYDGMIHRGLIKVSFEQFWQDFELMGVQRHLKASGIFCRLHHRDGKSGYLADIPRTLQYITDVASRYDELKVLSELIDHHILSHFIQTHG
jgi:N-acetylmuramate 1-kinase